MKKNTNPILPITTIASAYSTPGLTLLDASFYMPASGINADERFAQQHLPHAQRFDIDEITDPNTDLPHMLPDEHIFTEAMSNLAITSGSHVINYQQADASGAARAWWMFRAFGFPDDQVQVLDAGWERFASPPSHSATPPLNQPPFIAKRQPQLIADKATVLAAIQHNQTANTEDQIQILDARSAERFTGLAAEPRPGLRSGHMPSAINLPFQACFDAQGHWLTVDQLRQLFADHSIDPRKPTITTCGSGVTACILALALYQLGNTTAKVYDGSWSEWGADDSLPIMSNAR